MTDAPNCYETVDASTRAEVLERYDYRCQACGRRGPEAGGTAILHVHHIERHPSEMDVHDVDNLTLWCRRCHSWQHEQPTDDDLPVDLTEADRAVLLPKDGAILRILAADGPATTGEIAEQLPLDLTVMATRARLWVLAGLDNQVSSRDRQIVDQDPTSGEWGLVGQLSTSARGRIPDDPQTLLQRIEDERVRQALARGVDRTQVAEVMDVHPRTTRYMELRALAYDFPLEAVDARGGRPPVKDVEDATGASRVTPDAADSDGGSGDAQDRPEPVADGTGSAGAAAEENLG